MIIITSSCLAGVCQILVLDYFLQLSVLLRFIHKRLLFELTSTLCIRHWIIILILPIIMLFGIAIQYSWTGKNYDHRDSWHRG
jgi:cellulose synthase/poly-beta-1,6-N-acetylglucosamine synthase-like glycosyltransferase